MDLAEDLVGLVVAVAVVSALARRIGIAAPLLLVVGGVIASYVPFVGDVELSPDVVLVGILPPLLYSAAIRTSLIDFRANIGAIGKLSVGLVVLTTLAVGVVAQWVLPISWPLAFAMGAVVAPPDAVAATAIAKRVGMPRRAVTIIEGESLVNDATAIVCLRTAIAGIAGTITVTGVLAEFGKSVLGGLAVGLVGAAVLTQLRRRIDDVITDTTVSLLTPFVLYLLAEEVHGSGVLAVVVGGLVVGHRAERFQSAISRIFERGNWATVQHVLEHTVFFLVGLQARTILDSVSDGEISAPALAAACVAVLAAVIVVRFVGVFASAALSRRDIPWQVPTLVGWAGMRGVVTLAAAFVIPEGTPYRDVVVVVAWVVALATLLLQGSTLPALVRRLGLSGPDPAHDALLESQLYQGAANAGIAALDEALQQEPDVPDQVATRLRQRAIERADAQWERLGGADETPSEVYARLRTHMLGAERDHVLAARDAGGTPDPVLRRVLAALDVEESFLLIGDRWNSSERSDELVHETTVTEASCVHLHRAARSPAPSPSSAVCDDCVRQGLRWVHLRMCLECGRVGCCDSSPGRHATGHYQGSGHPVMRSIEPGEAWRWCFVDEALG